MVGLTHFTYSQSEKTWVIEHFRRVHAKKRMDIEEQDNLRIGGNGFSSSLEHLKLGDLYVDFEGIHSPNLQFRQQAL